MSVIESWGWCLPQAVGRRVSAYWMRAPGCWQLLDPDTAEPLGRCYGLDMADVSFDVYGEEPGEDHARVTGTVRGEAFGQGRGYRPGGGFPQAANFWVGYDKGQVERWSLYLPTGLLDPGGGVATAYTASLRAGSLIANGASPLDYDDPAYRKVYDRSVVEYFWLKVHGICRDDWKDWFANVR